jgi:hypothetical protein
MQRAPLPHMSTSPPSGLKKRMRKSAHVEGWISSTPSEPTPVRRAMTWASQRVSVAGKVSARSSTTRKSLAAPCIFQKGMFMTGQSSAAAGEGNREAAAPGWMLAKPAFPGYGRAS